MNHPAFRSILFVLLRLFSYAAVLLFAYFMIRLDSFGPANEEGIKFLEDSYTEYTQELMLLIAGLLYAWVAVKFPKVRAFSILLAGFCFMALFREFNNYFHDLFKGAWQTAVGIILLITALLTYWHRKSLFRPFQLFLQTPAFGLNLASALIILLFSRLFGKKSIWENILEVEELIGAHRSVKNAAEESIELLGYSFLLIAAIEFAIWVYRRGNDMLEDSRWGSGRS
ncbi:MAG: hypothetical protein LAT68_15270 [Cyclobacteriaceae bacterium]|nr:hypothetical protein [Cyclobacteriaceae bacterium]MCH8517681.1 hypothetical protein [Cyclobacteriaceae bacterium]